MAELSFSRARAALLAEGVSSATIDLFFKNFQERPEVWRAFEAFSLEAANANRRIGAKAVMERVRWQVTIEQGGEFKVCNSYTAYYARIFELKHPEHKDFFEKRQVRGLQAA